MDHDFTRPPRNPERAGLAQPRPLAADVRPEDLRLDTLHLNSSTPVLGAYAPQATLLSPDSAYTGTFGDSRQAYDSPQAYDRPQSYGEARRSYHEGVAAYGDPAQLGVPGYSEPRMGTQPRLSSGSLPPNAMVAPSNGSMPPNGLPPAQMHNHSDSMLMAHSDGPLQTPSDALFSHDAGRADSMLMRHRSGASDMGGEMSFPALAGPAPPTFSTTSLNTSTDSGSSLHRASTLVPARGGLSTFAKRNVDEYRNRLKNDKVTDPEALFNYAKYLIEAAKRYNNASTQALAMGTQVPRPDRKEIERNAKNAKAYKRYRDSLIEEALKTLKKVTAAGYAEAQYFMGECHILGSIGLTPDRDKAFGYFSDAAHKDHPQATYRIAQCCEKGWGTKRDFRRALRLYTSAAGLGVQRAKLKLGLVYTYGHMDQPKDMDKAVHYLHAAADNLDEPFPQAMYELAVIYENTSRTQPVHIMHARQYYIMAAEHGFPAAQYKLGVCFEYGTLEFPVDPRMSILWYTRAASQGECHAELALSGWYLTGSPNVIRQSDQEAFLWAKRAATKGLPKAEYALGYYFENGIGCQLSIADAKLWYDKSSAHGNIRARHRLHELQVEERRQQNKTRPTRQQASSECIIS